MKEYKILSGIFTNVQKTLNQWKHLYDLNIIAMTSTGPGNITILLTRIERS